MSHHSLSQYDFCKTIVRTVDDATAHLTNIHKIEQTTIDYENKTKEEEKSILVESKIDDGKLLID
ncbi:hypothetical protein DERP_014487 [Dermatophagoides pteronyssinus]|uniref:Uncharacterized protein n=1 Tax=Dermatophagoides pteronyssinus TaxID=6956 RepID=A0ABQ8IUT9_DERPT|nr:hypothetical protein DERP_014487 [Dermatophagoides pteronyssinus]